jgi:putative ABC transport system substrate-binding protein
VCAWSRTAAIGPISDMGGLRFLQRTLSHHPPFRWGAFRVLMVKIEGQARVAGEAMRRRNFVLLLGGTAAWPLAARAQQWAMPVIGFLRVTSLNDSAHLVTAFQRGLKEAGFVEGQNVAIEYRWADGQNERLPELAADLVNRQVAVIVGHSNAVQAAKAASATIPIIFVVGNDPVRTGLVANLNRPGGNVTGVTFTTVDVISKRLGQLHEPVPKPELIGVLLDPNLPEFDVELDVEIAAKTIGRRVLFFKAASPSELNAAFGSIVQAGVGALLVGGGPFFTSQRQRLAVLSARHAIPSSYTDREFAVAGGLMSYGPSQTDAYRRAGIYAGRILKGEKAGDLPVEQPTKFEFVINVGTAAALGIAVPNSMQLIADEVIE